MESLRLAQRGEHGRAGGEPQDRRPRKPRPNRVDRPARFPSLLNAKQGAALASSCGLTPRELEVLAALTCGLSDAGIGAELRVSVETARKHRQAVLRKCGCTSRLQLVLWLVHDHLLATGPDTEEPTGGSTP